MAEQLSLFEPATATTPPQAANEVEVAPVGPTSRSASVREALSRIRYEEDAVVGRAGLGWRYTADRNEHGRRQVELDVAELDTVHRLLELHAEGRSLRAIATTLTAEGRKTKRGGAWHASTVRAVLARGH